MGSVAKRASQYQATTAQARPMGNENKNIAYGAKRVAGPKDQQVALKRKGGIKGPDKIH